METNDKALWQVMGGNALQQQQFASPWSDASIRYVPRNIKDALTLSEYLYLNYGVYRAASERIVNYFLTNPIFKGLDDVERVKFEKIMNKDISIIERLKEVGYDYMAYGNAFCSVHLPFKRVLRCARCSTEGAIDHPKLPPFHFDTGDFTFHRRCSKCKEITRHMWHDYRNQDSKKIRVVRWDPKRIFIEPNELTGDNRYWLDIPSRIQSKVRLGDPYVLSTIPSSFLAAIKNNQKYRFNDDSIFHLREASLAGVFLSGWGIPSVLSAFKNFFRLQVLLRYDETLMMDYIVPLRILSPQTINIPIGNDFVQVNMSNFVNTAEDAIRKHRIDGADWLFMPFGVNYQAIGAEGQSFSHATKDVIGMEEDRLLQIRGCPTEIYKNTLSTQAAPVALRLFERTHTPLVNGLSRLLSYVSGQVSMFMDHGESDAELESIKIVDNIEDKQWRIQAAMGNAISKQTGLGPLGIDYKEETKRMIQEAMDQQKQQNKAQQNAQMEAMSLGGDQQGQGQGQQSGGMTPGDVEQQGDEIARQLLDPQMPEANRRQQLNSLRQTNDTLHAVVIKKMDQLRNQAGVAGRQAGFQQLGIGKSASFDRRPQQAQILFMMDAWFPADADHAHSMRYDFGKEKSRFDIWYKGASHAVFADDEDIHGEPMQFVSNIADMLLRKKL